MSSVAAATSSVAAATPPALAASQWPQCRCIWCEFWNGRLTTDRRDNPWNVPHDHALQGGSCPMYVR
ncbi:hypothetical protein PI126_g13131 [Phytophthora idaei]|nr:hypothetical protein PI126_g13131 [Phytophthora idaei]